MRRSQDCPTSFWQSLISFVLLEIILKSMTSFSLSDPTISKNWSRSEKINSNRSISSQLHNLYQLKSSRCLVSTSPCSLFLSTHLLLIPLACGKISFCFVQKEMQSRSIYHTSCCYLIYHSSCCHLQFFIHISGREPWTWASNKFRISRCSQSCSSSSWQVTSCEDKPGTVEDLELYEVPHRF